jgi:hypothetical protein
VLRGILALVGAAVLAAPASAAEFDAWRYRARVGTAQVEADRQTLFEKMVAGELDRGGAERLAALAVAGASKSTSDYRRRWREVMRACAAYKAEMDLIRGGGPYKPGWIEDRWLKNRAAATAPEARRLFEQVFLDQWQQKYDPGLDRAGNMAVGALMNSEIQTNYRSGTSWLKAVLARIGWFDISRYGEEASQAAWLIVQHSDYDPEWQKRMLKVLEPRVKSGDMQGKYYAYLVDRVASNAKRPQVYGTQGRCVGKGDWQPFDVVDPAKLDGRRSEVGLEPIDEYRRRFTCP